MSVPTKIVVKVRPPRAFEATVGPGRSIGDGAAMREGGDASTPVTGMFPKSQGVVRPVDQLGPGCHHPAMEAPKVGLLPSHLAWPAAWISVALIVAGAIGMCMSEQNDADDPPLAVVSVAGSVFFARLGALIESRTAPASGGSLHPTAEGSTRW